MTLPQVIDVVCAALVLVGGAFALVGSLGLLRLSDLLQRLHGPTKAGTIGVGAVLVASMLHFATAGRASLRELLITLFVAMTAPVAAHLLIRAAFRRDATLRPPPPPEADPTHGSGR
ncbi:MAG TPA: Na+/H+ antiporter subunit G [Burkholderiaceae bacterium]|nr:Na+/H+ antiporter subunit G [Burkholderiaceae bacterium]